MRKVIIAVVAGMVISTLAHADIKAGKWTITMTTRMDGQSNPMAEMEAAMANMTEEEKAMMEQMMGGMNIQMGPEGISTTTVECVSADSPVPQMEEMKDCTMSHDINGDVVTFEATCPDSKSSGTLTYSDESMAGVINSMVTEDDGEIMSVTMDVTGTYEGPCEE